MSKGALRVDKAIWELYENIPHLLCEQPYGKNGRYITYYAEERLYLVFDLWYHGFFLVEADSVVCALGFRPKTKEVDELCEKVDEYYIIGDCNRVAMIYQAMDAGYHAARRV